MISAIRLPALQIDQRGGGGVAVAGLGHAGDFAHQFHVAFSASVSGACVFSGQPFNCAVSKFAQDDLVAVTPHTRVPNCQGCPEGKTLPFDHCKTSPHVIDVGSMVDCPRNLTLTLNPHPGPSPSPDPSCSSNAHVNQVDYPRRHCGQNPVTTQRCFDDVAHLKASRTFVFRGTADAAAAPGAAESVVGLLAQMVTDPPRPRPALAPIPNPRPNPSLSPSPSPSPSPNPNQVTDPATSLKLVADLPFPHVLPLPSTPHANASAPAVSGRHSNLGPHPSADALIPCSPLAGIRYHTRDRCRAAC
jgi:hypothetical protein